MYVENIIEVYENTKPRFNRKMYFSMATDDVKPGYTQLQLEHGGGQPVFYCCIPFNGKHYFSSLLQKYRFLDIELELMHGPCISDHYGNYDYAFCLHCKTWISPALQWITRSSSSWPSYDVKKSIVNHGVLFVPIGVKGSPKEDLEWRISFSVGEKLLINTFTHTQLVCYALLKVLLKDVISTFSKCKDLLCSYFLKTIIFWMSEELPQFVWKPENLILCFMQCFSRLIYCCEHSACYHYFIPENNLFENKIEGRSREILLEILYTMHSCGWRCILFSDQISNFHVSMSNIYIEPHTIYATEVEKILNVNLIDLTRSLIESHRRIGLKVFNRAIHQIFSCDQSSIKYLCAYYMSMWRATFAQFIPLKRTYSSNKDLYKQYKACLSSLLQNIYHDALSGWLMLASFFYKTHQYSKALLINQYCLSKCTSEKLYHSMKMSDTHHKALKLKSLQKKSFVHLWKLMLVDVVVFHINSELTPDELQIEEQNMVQRFPSIPYAHFLNFLCHYHLRNVRQCENSFLRMHMEIGENISVYQLPPQINSYNLLGVAFQLKGDIKSARQAYLQSVELVPDPIFNFAVKRLSLMS